MKEIRSIDVARVAIRMAMSRREDESALKERYGKEDIKVAAVDYGGEYINSISKIIERAVVAAKREGVIEDNHVGEGAVAGATHEAIMQIKDKAMGLNIGGKIGIAFYGEHLCVCAFFAVGMLNLNEVAIGLGHRSLKY
ncbi:HutP family protein [Thermoanaerobacterium thermosaccharolyticum]|uniref:HutP family protein n=1 Tax=Thermoanaerobacterium thermosaccharolyticum TaxID=1517 RepID=UPI00178478C3|nr:HutP family protein [Thermoanaerobacterium thermosaccharolyticum]MBE0067814.1 hut operon positive regulator HutP [Thermoanaerobacterium thermosaccharolyticum]MBE0227377.1 hut operon positive regulator HutP [Thermoanaerobacterium thermosaccharolyticum]